MTTDKAMPKNLADFLEAHPELTAVKQDRGDTAQVFEIICTECKAELWVNTTTQEGAELNVYDGQFSNRKMNIIECEVLLKCECPDKTYDTPEDFEISW